MRRFCCIAASFFLSAAVGQAHAQGLVGRLSTGTALVEVVSALNVPAGAIESANEMLAGESSRFESCLSVDGDGDGPWMFRIGLRTNDAFVPSR